MKLFATFWKGIIRRTCLNKHLNGIMFFHYFGIKSAFLSAVIKVTYFVSIIFKGYAYEASISFALWFKIWSKAVKISKAYQISIFSERHLAKWHMMPLSQVTHRTGHLWEWYAVCTSNVAPLICMKNLAHPDGSGSHMKCSIRESLM